MSKYIYSHKQTDVYAFECLIISKLLTLIKMLLLSFLLSKTENMTYQK